MISLLIVTVATLGDLPPGMARVTAEVSGKTIDVFTYKPASYKDGPLIVVFHGSLRNADEYRNDARAMGDRFGVLIAAPKFDERQFGQGKYQQGGLMRDGKPTRDNEWTWTLVPKIVDAIRKREGRPDMPYYLVGHSAGGQFLSRLAGFVPTEARRIVVSNPSTHLFPTRELNYPYGLGGLPDLLSDEKRIRRYLACPVTIYLGTADTERDEDLDTSDEADRQGRSRLERGRNAFRTGLALAKANGWEFGWRLVEAPGVGHDHIAMFNAPRCRVALFGEESPPGTR